MAKDEKVEKQKLSWKDYIAMIVALLTTTLLPTLIIIVLLIIVLVISLHFF